MDLVDLCSATSKGENKRRVNKKNRNWRRRLHLRKTVAQPPAMQSEDKRGPKKIAEEWDQTPVWPSSKKPPLEAQRSRCMTNDSGSILRFTCTQCKDNLEYASKDLMRHFVEKHRGIPPVFSCHFCNFSTNELSYLQVHLLSHKNTFPSCSICNDNVQRSWSEFSAHLSTNHCPNGNYSCEMCQKFSTGDVEGFLEHMYGHNLDMEEAEGVDVSLHKKDNQLSTTQTLRCQYCDFEASQKFLVTKHINTVHVCKDGNQRKKKSDVHSKVVKPNDAIPRMKARLTRSAVKDMCWLTQDCLSLPGREFLDKYCHLSDPQTTLEETQQFLMESVAGETDDQKWTKALKTVLSNVPKDMNLHHKLENGIMSSPSDLAVLRVKNKITVAQNGATYSKRLKMMTSTDKETVFPESADAHCAVNHNGCESNLKDQTPCPQVENNLPTDVSVSVQSEPSQCARMQENRENRDLKTDQEVEEHNKKLEGPVNADGKHISGILKLAMESEETTPVCRALPRRKGQSRCRKRKGRFKKVGKRLEGETLKIVLKKNPVKGKQWVSQSSLPPLESDVTDGHLYPHTAMEDTTQTLDNVQPTEVDQRNLRRGSMADPLEAITSVPESEPVKDFTLCCSVKAVEPENMTGNEPNVPQGFPSGKSQVFLETEVDGSRLASRARQMNQRAKSVTEVEMVQLQKSHGAADCHVVDSKKGGETPRSSGKSSPVSLTVTPQDKLNVENSCLERSAGESGGSVEERRNGEVPTDSCCDLTSSIHLPGGKAIQQKPSPEPGVHWQPVPKHQERTLKLVAINPSQLVKRPVGDQPVVVLNHPDADIPQVAKIMEVVNRYREVRKVILSRRTLNALAALNGELAESNDQTTQTEPARQGETSVQERFTLKLKLRRLNRKKYEIVEAVCPNREFVSKFPCWFCGRVFISQEAMLAHRQRHLMEWKRPKCENS